MINSLAEIQRLCIEVPGKFQVVKTMGNTVTINGGLGDWPASLIPVPHPSVDFNIWSNGEYYLVEDMQQGWHKLYKLREQVQEPVPVTLKEMQAAGRVDRRKKS